MNMIQLTSKFDWILCGVALFGITITFLWIKYLNITWATVFCSLSAIATSFGSSNRSGSPFSALSSNNNNKMIELKQYHISQNAIVTSC